MNTTGLLGKLYEKYSQRDPKTDSKEVSLVLLHKLTGIKYLHYGFWDENAKPSLRELPAAQERYAELLIHTLDDHLQQMGLDKQEARLLDVGCGTGALLCELNVRDYPTDAVVPSQYMHKEAQKALERLPPDKKAQAKIFLCRFEELKRSGPGYDLIFFSESFQYVQLDQAFDKLRELLNPHARVVICDFFSLPGTKNPARIGGGHKLPTFYAAAAQHQFKILMDRDITKNVSPNFRLLNETLTEKVGPASTILHQFLSARHPWIYGTASVLMQKRIKKVRQKYLSGQRTQENFERLKSYRLIALERLP